MTNTNENQQVKWSKNDWIMLGTNALLFVIFFIIFDNRLPANMASHYNIHGEQDGTMAKWSFWLMYAGIGLALPTFLSAMRYIDPRKNNYSRFEGYYQLMRWAISLFIHAVILLVILDNIGYKLPAIQLVVGGIGLLWMIIGNRMGQVRSNFFVGIKTPWALSDENNWRLTHRLAARLWFIAGLLMFASAWFVPSPWTVGVLLTCALASSLIPTVYSYILSRRK
ncbi:SdpI family protein [Cohnella silvisoli]|uniref:SdpI family protein n=1 Tax=Cohnella silvisoli TaxID=2873699 RepID=A0ABV1KQU7_9BACL|nr:SdpI family protein [Cohnella silvisoli]MCD9022350.1 SdpI family protein [Cohnella silvisoli]